MLNVAEGTFTISSLGVGYVEGSGEMPRRHWEPLPMCKHLVDQNTIHLFSSSSTPQPHNTVVAYPHYRRKYSRVSDILWGKLVKKSRLDDDKILTLPRFSDIISAVQRRLKKNKM